MLKSSKDNVPQFLSILICKTDDELAVYVNDNFTQLLVPGCEEELTKLDPSYKDKLTADELLFALTHTLILYVFPETKSTGKAA